MTGHYAAVSCGVNPPRMSRSNPNCERMILGVAFAAIALCSGCGNPWSSANTQLRATRSKFLAATEPIGGAPLTEIRTALDSNQPVVAIGRIGVPDQESWIAGKAAFAIRDAAGEKPGDHGGNGHDSANCPFCKRKASQPDTTALVQFLDEQGEIIRIDARELFELADNQRVVVEGKAAIAGPDVLVITAEKLYVTPE